jgi:hypothetical protein
MGIEAFAASYPLLYYFVFLVVVVFLALVDPEDVAFFTLSVPCGRAFPYDPLNVFPRRVLLSPRPINSPSRIGVLIHTLSFPRTIVSEIALYPSASPTQLPS